MPTTPSKKKKTRVYQLTPFAIERLAKLSEEHGLGLSAIIERLIRGDHFAAPKGSSVAATS